MKYEFVNKDTTEAASGVLPVITKEMLNSLPDKVAKPYLDQRIIQPVGEQDAETVSIELEAQIRETAATTFTAEDLRRIARTKGEGKATLLNIAHSIGANAAVDVDSVETIIQKILDKQNSEVK